MNDDWKGMTWRQFGAAIDMLENAVRACPDSLWEDDSRHPQFWHAAFHALFFLDLYLSESDKGFAPPPPFEISELDPNGRTPARTYTKSEIAGYFAHCRKKCRDTILGMSPERAARPCGFYWLKLTDAELLLYNMRHVQHHAAQLNLILRQTTDSAPGWVSQVKTP